MTQQINGSCGETAPGVGEGSPGCKGFGSQGFWCLKAHPLGLLGSWSLVLMAGPEMLYPASTFPHLGTPLLLEIQAAKVPSTAEGRELGKYCWWLGK